MIDGLSISKSLKIMKEDTKSIKSSDNIDDKELKGFYLDIAFAAMKVFDDYEIFLSDFISFKKKIKNNPKKIELYLRNTNKYDNHQGMLTLLYRYKTLENKLINADKKFLSDLPDKFNEEWDEFNKNYKYFPFRKKNCRGLI